MGHFKVTCKAFKRSQNKEVSKGDTKNKAGGEAAELMGIWDSNFTEPAGVRGISTPDYLSGEIIFPYQGHAVGQWGLVPDQGGHRAGGGSQGGHQPEIQEGPKAHEI